MIQFVVQSQGISVFGMELVLKVKEIGLSDKDRRYQARNSCYQIWKSVCPENAFEHHKNEDETSSKRDADEI